MTSQYRQQVIRPTKEHCNHGDRVHRDDLKKAKIAL